MIFKNAAALESLVWQLRLDDFPRSDNRAKVNELFDGWPPYTSREVEQNNITFNFNDLSATKIAHDARRQFYNGIVTPEPYFFVTLDYGPIYRRREWGDKVTRNIGRIMKRSKRYRETLRNLFALDVMHGIGPALWHDRFCWRPRAVGVDDVLVPAGTYLDMENLTMFFNYYQWTGMELHEKTHGPSVDPRWNVPLAEDVIEWADQQAVVLQSQSWPEVWMPEKLQQRLKEDTGLFSDTKVPTIDVYDCYWYEDSKKYGGWNRAIILDAWGTPSMGAGGVPQYSRARKFEFGRNEFLYRPSEGKKYAGNLEEIISFQFADGSCVAPFRYHAVRSLGFLLFNVCHIQNRLRCKFTEAAFESMLQYLRSTNPEDAERALKINLIDKRVLPTGIDFVKHEERWQIPDRLVQEVIALNRQTMADNSASFTQDFDFAEERKHEETATRTMAKVNSTAALVGAMLAQAYDYQEDQSREILRRFCIKNSKDPDVRRFQLDCYHDGVPEEALDCNRMDLQMNRVIGSGNKILQMNMMDKMMTQYYPLLNPEAQQKVLKMGVAITTDDYDLANQLVPESPHISDSIVAAQNAFAALMSGGGASFKPGWNLVEFIETLLHSIATKINDIGAEGVPAPAELIGLQKVQQFLMPLIGQLGRDARMRQKVKQYGDDLGKLANLIKAYAQRLQQQRQAGNGAGQIDPKDAAKVQATILTAQTKAQLAQQSHGQRTAQRQIQFEQKLRQDAQQHRADLAAKDLQAASDIQRKRFSVMDEQ